MITFASALENKYKQVIISTTSSFTSQTTSSKKNKKFFEKSLEIKKNTLTFAAALENRYTKCSLKKSKTEFFYYLQTR